MHDAPAALPAPRATDGATLPAWVLAAREDPALAFVERAWTRAAATPGAWYDEALAEAIVALWPRYFRHTEGRWAGKPFHLRPWQAAIVRLLVGWRNADGFRLFRRLPMRRRQPFRPQTSRAISRSRNFWIFPVEVFGISVKTTWRGHL